MYTRQQASLIRQKFWTSFGQYMKPVRGAGGETINWLNYKTGIRHLYFRMDADAKHTSIFIEIRHPDPAIQQYYFEKLQQVKQILENVTGEQWKWQLLQEDEHRNIISSIGLIKHGVNVFDETNWPAIISFLKPRIIALDEFWVNVKDGFE